MFMFMCISLYQVSVDISQFEETIRAYHRLLELRPKHTDVEASVAYNSYKYCLYIIKLKCYIYVYVVYFGGNCFNWHVLIRLQCTFM